MVYKRVKKYNLPEDKIELKNKMKTIKTMKRNENYHNDKKEFDKCNGNEKSSGM